MNASPAEVLRYSQHAAVAWHEAIKGRNERQVEATASAMNSKK